MRMFCPAEESAPPENRPGGPAKQPLLAIENEAAIQNCCREFIKIEQLFKKYRSASERWVQQVLLEPQSWLANVAPILVIPLFLRLSWHKRGQSTGNLSFSFYSAFCSKVFSGRQVFFLDGLSTSSTNGTTNSDWSKNMEPEPAFPGGSTARTEEGSRYSRIVP